MKSEYGNSCKTTMEAYLTGQASISIKGIFASGTFVNGKLTNGVMIYSDTHKEGTFENDELHGEDCKLTVGNTKYEGLFERGRFVKGRKFQDGKIMEEGRYNCNAVTQRLIIASGTRYENDRILAGTFNSAGQLASGRISYETGIVYTGSFLNNSMVKGNVTYPNGFEAEYELYYDNERRIDILKSCSVKYTGKWEDLNTKQAIFMCCKGADSRLAYKFYIDYLQNFSAPALLLLKREFFNKYFTADEEVGLQQILTNISSYFTNGTSDIINNPKIEDPLPFEMESRELDRHY